MNMTLINKIFEPCGIFGELYVEDGEQIAVTLQHAYPFGEGFGAKIPEGSYLCKRGQHQLEGMNHTFETFEVTGVPGHTNILFHVGNYNDDSEGCILLGEKTIISAAIPMITNSSRTFQLFMDIQSGFSQFTLTVLNSESA